MTPTLLRHRLLITFLALVAVTLLSAALSAGSATTGGAVGVVVLALGFAKARFVLTEFMELHRAPRLLRAIFDLWVLGAGTLLVVLLLAWSWS